ncbi:MAG: serine/threonine protein kinase [Chloroflexota bacterium]|nr:serine/threonine protein kinase [Chloroflexota bacterium]
MLQEQMTLPIGAIVQDKSGDRYRVEELLGKGGSGAVYLVRDRRTREHVFALKEITDPSNQDRQRLLFECEVLKRLDHTALPRVYHVFGNEKLKRVYMLMEYIQGKNLEIVRREQPEQRFSLDLALNMMSPIVDALVYMHHQWPPIVHRDIKPSNIIVPRDGREAVLVDFGTAKEYLPDNTTMAFRHGSPGYAAIEQYGGGSGTDMGTDVYGLGATFYTVLTGVTPIDAISRVTANGKDPLKPVSALVPTIPVHISDTIQRAMSIHKSDRFPTVEGFWRMLRADPKELAAHSPETPIPATAADQETPNMLAAVPPRKPRGRVSGRRAGVLSIMFVLLLTLVLGLGFFLRTSHGITPATRTAHTGAPRITTPSPPANPGASLYPRLGSSYAGKVSDISVAHTTTALYLAGIQQDQGHFQGEFQGLGLAGPFTGTVTPGGKLHFTVKVYSGNTTLIFDGAIKVGGDLTGSFNATTENNQNTSEYGLWYASATS